MSISGVILAAIVIGGVGIIIGVILGIAGEKFKVETDPRVDAIEDVLPGNNCGGCGFPGCSGLAAAIASGEAPVNTCPVGGAAVAEKIGKIMGAEAGETVHMVAYVKCNGTCENATQNYEYYGEKDCSMQSFIPGGGAKACRYGCLGYGECVSVCPFDAVHIIDGVAVVDKEECRACGKCVSTCPRHLIEMVPYEAKHIVQCSSKDIGKNVMPVCKVGCIGCRMCEKTCPFEAITVEENIAHIDQGKCKKCGACAKKCPKKVITA